jgi:hypothetical protein
MATTTAQEITIAIQITITELDKALLSAKEAERIAEVVRQKIMAQNVRGK